MVQRLKIAVNQKQLWLGFVPLISLSGITCLLLNSRSFAAIPEQIDVRIAQQPANSNAAKQVFQEAWQLYQQGTAVYPQVTAELLRQAIPKFEQAVILYRQAGDKGSETLSLVYLSLIYDSLGEKQKALEFHNQALLLTRPVGDKGGEATTKQELRSELNSQNTDTKRVSFFLEQFLTEGYGFLNEGRAESWPEAIKLFKASIPLLRLLGNRSREATTLNNIGIIYSRLSEKSLALEYYNQALSLYQAVGDRGSEGTALNNIGAIYSHLGEKRWALEYYQKALTIFQVLRDRNGEADLLDNICSVYSSLGEYRQALEYCDKAFKAYKAISNYGGEADSLYSIGKIYSNLGDYKQALEYYGQVRPLIEIYGGPGGVAPLLNDVGEAFFALGETGEALKYYEQALHYHQAVGNPYGIQETLYNFAYLKRSQGNLTAALTDIEAVIKIIESLRTKIGSQDLRTSYFATVQDYYQFYIDLLMQLHQQNPSRGYDALALHISERARARSLLEQLTEASLNLKADLNPALKAEEQRLTQALNAADRKRINLLAGSPSNDELEAVKAEIDNISNQFQNLEARIRRDNPAYANLKYPDPLTLSEIQTKILDDKTLLLQYALGKDRSYLFLISKTALKTYKLPPKAEIEAAVGQYRELLQSENFTDLSQGEKLSQMLLGQIAGELKGQRLVIVGDGKLQLLPFAALPWGSGASLAPLLKNHEIITLPSATSLAVQREQWQKRQPAPKTLAVIADPVFQANDPRLGNNATNASTGDLSQEPTLRNSCGKFDRLPHTATEAEQILALVPDAQEFSAIGFDANYATAINPNLSQYRILHLATHGCIQDNPLLSNLALSFFTANGQRAETSLLKLQDIYNLELNADLVVLSACQTGTGKEVRGEGIVGLTRGFMYAGARRVAVSLWSVNDRATSILMSDFYRQMLEQKVDPAAALRQAQLTMWQSGGYSAPYYWAAFTMQGDW